MKKFFKWFFISFSVFLILLFTVTAFLNDKYSVERSVSINAPKDSVFTYIANLNTWHKWNPWFLADAKMKNKITITDSLTGSSWQWESKLLGNGILRFEKVYPTDSIYAVMEFTAPKHTVIQEYWTFKTKGDSTIVFWEHVGPLDYPLGRIFGLWSNSMLGPTFEQGLNAIKSQLENKNKTPQSSGEKTK